MEHGRTGKQRDRGDDHHRRVASKGMKKVLIGNTHAGVSTAGFQLVNARKVSDHHALIVSYIHWTC